jgi:hypothetical protein
LVAVCPRTGETWELQRPRAAQPGWEERRRREKEPFKNGARPKGRLCLSKRKKRPQN